ncbi:MAG: 50S ribosomal protein L22 [Armatimonadetes bacterium JP3_11]|jgi:large subunit ribosomal protein L22|nr:MAG: 50S ribosomal protein L22 [Armatimonadetes bacterium CP1_7O]OYT75145.1 MAG: 50S ribosomal protein L22 [Armatimonadetes bacterium JP3_11]RMH06406.1 MAG: 50S ribosomal protein L22 [Armatimonadota bacterium]
MKAVARHVRIPPRKARLAIDLVRGKPVGEALVILQRLPNKSARIAKKVLESAVANAVHNDGLSPSVLYIERAYVDEGPRWKRILPKDRGRAFRILKRTSHITIELGIGAPQAQPRGRRARSTAASQQEEQK